MQLYIQQGSTPYYRCTYFEHSTNRYFACMVDLNKFIGVLVPLPRLLPAEVEIHPCNSDWSVVEETVLATYHGLFFSDDYLTSCVESFIQSL